MVWQDISSAPKDGRWIWVRDKKHPGIARRVRWGVRHRKHGPAWLTQGHCYLSNLPTQWSPDEGERQ